MPTNARSASVISAADASRLGFDRHGTPKTPSLEQQLTILDELGITLSDEQYEALSSRSRLKLYAGGERGGKSFITALELVTKCLWGKLFWIVAADYNLARPEFEYAVDWLGELGAIRSSKDVSLPKWGRARAQLKTGQIIETKSADDVRKIAARSPDGICMVEAALQPFESFTKALGRLTETRGWLIMSGTFEGSSGWFVEKYNDWQTEQNLEGGRSFSIPTWANKAIFPGGREDPEIKRLEALYSKVPGLFDERCGAKPSPPIDLVFRKFRETIHLDSRANYNPHKDVFLAIDPSGGTNPYAVGVYQFYSPEELTSNPKDKFTSERLIDLAAPDVDDPMAYDLANPTDAVDFAYLVDVVYERGMVDEEIIDLCMNKGWWSNVQGGAIDVEAPDSRKRWLKYGGVRLWSKKIPVVEGIRRLQSFLFYTQDPETMRFTWPPHILVNPKVKEFAYEANRFKRPKPLGGTKQGMTYEHREKPPPNQPDHLLKATWYLLIGRYGYIKSHIRHQPSYGWRNPLKKQPLKEDPEASVDRTLGLLNKGRR